ncbi:beach domain-containing protein [Anaeramoeba ignava]|uniref:Beach domain-containing protein n=1 Tax=Anaeramoeba ignava TaxID=1746090 RepID=A0A9Q0L9U5_ANAIG|nr:beach domain-containing protein [Anaeramoeba ignava]
MTFWRTVFKKQRSDANKTNQNNLTNKEQKEFSLKSNEIWEQLETLWEARKQITDPDAFYNWYIDLSSLFLAKSKEWKPPPSEKKIEKMFKFENKSKKKSKFSRKKKSVKSPWENLQELQDYSKLREFQISQAKDPKFSFILENISQPFEFIIDTLHVAYVLLDKLKKAFVISKGQSFSIPFNLINLSTSLEVLSILSRSKINQQIMIRFGLIHELKSIANVSLQFYSLISQTDVSLYSPDKTLTLVQIQNMLYFQFLQLNLLIIISNISNIPLLELSIEYLEKIANTKLTIDFEFLSQLEAVELLKDLFQKSIELSRFYINEWQHLIHINFLNLIMNSIRSRKFINNFNEKLLENGFSAFMQFRQPKKILSFPISFLDEKEFSFLNIMKLWQEQSQNQIQEESGMSMNEKKDIIKIFKYINSILFLIHVSEFIENDNYFVEQFVCNHPRIMELSNFTLWISFKFLPDDINRLMKENKQVLNEKVEKKAQHYCSPKINSIDNCFRLIKNAVEKNYFGNEKRIPLPKNVEFKDFFVMQNISTHLVQETKIDHEFESNNHLRYLFQILLKISRNSHTQTAENNEKKQENIPIRDRIIENLLNIFRIEDNQKVLKYRNIIHNLWPQLQLEILSLLMQILDQNVLDKLKEKKYWSIFFSSYFIPEINSTFIATKESTQLFSIVNDLLMKIIYEAGYKEQTSNIEECGILVEFLEYNRHNLNIIGQVMTAIFGILERKYKMAVSSLTTIKIIPVVTGIIHETFWYQIGLKQDGEEDEKKQNMEIETVQVPVARYNQYTREYSLEKLFQVRLQMFDFINLFLSNKAHRKLMVENFGNELTSILLTLLLEKETRDFSLQHLSFNLGTTPSKQPPNIWKEMGTNILRFVRVLFEEETKRKKKKDDQITDIQGDLEKESLIELMKDVMTMVSDCITNHQEILQYMLMDIGVFQFVMELLKEPETANKLFVEIMHLLIELFRGSDPTVVEKFEKEIGHDELRKAIWECQMKKQTEIAFQLLLEMLVNNNYSQQKQAPIRSQESRNSFGIQRLFDCERNYIIQNRHVVMVMFRLFTQGDPHPDLPLFLNLLDTFTIICERSLHNTSCCCEVGLVGFLVDLIPHVWGSNSRFSDSLQNVEEEQILQKIRNQTVRLLGGIGSHRITVKELKNIFSLLQSVDGLARPSFSPLVLSALYKMLRNKDRDDNVQPSAFFDFDGRLASLEIPFISEWPAVKGMTFCTWIRIESLQDPLNKPDYEPRIFSFMNKNGRGIELYFRNDNESDQNYLGMTLTTSIEEERDQSQEINSNTKINNYINKNIKTDGAIQIETESNMKNINVNVNVNANVNVNNANADVNFNSNTETSKNNSETKEQKRRKSSAKVIDEKLKQQLKSKRQIPIGWKQQPLQPQNEGAGDISSQKEQVIERDVLLIIRVVFANCSDFAVFPIRIPIKRWFCLGLTHSQSRWTSSGEARVYLNGESGGSRAGLKFSQFGGGFTHNRIGSNFGFSEPEENEAILGRSKRENPFCGQMGAIYFFDEALTASQLRDIYQLGASYAGNFEAVANPQSGRVQTSPHISQSGVLDGSLSSKIFLSLNSRACSLHHCFDQSSRGVVDKLRIVSMFNCISRNLADIVGCVGGVRALFPLFAQLDQPEATPQNLIALRNRRKSSISNSTILTDTTNLTDSKNLADSTNLNNLNNSNNLNDSKNNLIDSNDSNNLNDSTNNLIDSKNDSNNLIDSNDSKNLNDSNDLTNNLIDSKNNSTNNLNDSKNDSNDSTNNLIDSKNNSNNLIDSKNNSKNNLIDSKNNSFVIKNSFRIKETPLTKNSPQNKSQIDFSINPNLSGQIFDLIAKMLILNNANVQDIVNRRGISVLGYLFRTISPQHMSIEIVKTIKKLLFQVENTQLSHDIIHSLVFNYDIWIYSRYEVQERLISDILLKSLLQERKKLPVYFEMNCRPLFLILRSYYWMKPDKFSKAGEPKRSTETQEIIGKRPEIEQMVTLRASILECVYRVLLIFPTEANFSQLIHYCLEMTQQRRTRRDPRCS